MTIVRGDERNGATFSQGERYRYALWRRWGDGPRVHFLMLNPSTADEAVLDPTVRRCVGYAQAWGYGGLLVSNLFALRSTDPRALLQEAITRGDPVGPLNDSFIEVAVASTPLTICAWGRRGDTLGRAPFVLDALRRAGLCGRLHLLRTTKSGHPEHPLYLPKTLTPIRFRPAIADVTAPT